MGSSFARQLQLLLWLHVKAGNAFKGLFECTDRIVLEITEQLKGITSHEALPKQTYCSFRS